ncbi:HNH endonuclease signature motif containing protein [Xenorhabdus szentirmaii]|uniref:HNH endonuclease signature motif containing protein n=1 Tax=Xenorhabdus szentirmaii TaxID=290112 RepID=UPI0032B784B6
MEWIKCICSFCNKEFLKKRAEIKRTKKNFCSRQCSGEFKSKNSRDSFFDRYNPVGDCWEWSGCRDGCGYGLVSIGGVRGGAHRFSYIFSKGEIPDGMVVMHSCDNPACINPSHLSLGTHTDNMRDMIRKERHNHKLNKEERIKVINSGELSKTLSLKYDVSERTIRLVRQKSNISILPQSPTGE